MPCTWICPSVGDTQIRVSVIHGCSNFGGPTMLTTMTEDDWTIVLQVFGASRSRRGDKGRDDRKFLEALHYFAVHNITWRAGYDHVLPKASSAAASSLSRSNKITSEPTTQFANGHPHLLAPTLHPLTPSLTSTRRPLP